MKAKNFDRSIRRFFIAKQGAAMAAMMTDAEISDWIHKHYIVFFEAEKKDGKYAADSIDKSALFLIERSKFYPLRDVDAIIQLERQNSDQGYEEL